MKSILFTMKATAVVLALFAMVLLSSCSPSTVPLCRVGINRGDSSRTITAVVDPLGSNIYYRTKYKGSDDSYSYSSNTTNNYNKLSSEGILVSQGLWEVQIVFSNEDRKYFTEEEAESLIHASSGDIYINLNTTSITVELESGDGYVQISSYKLTGSVLPSSPSIEAQLMYYNGNAFVSFDNADYDISSFSPLTPVSNNDFSNTQITLPSGVYCLVLKVKSSSSVVFTDVLGFVVRKGLTTTISGSCSNYNGVTNININSEYLRPLNPEGGSSGSGSGSGTGSDSGYAVVDIEVPKGSTGNTVDFSTVQDKTIHVIQSNSSDVTLSHNTTSGDNLTSSRINTPKDTTFAINLNGKNVTLTKEQNNANGVENESALVTNLTSSYLTIYNNNGTDSGVDVRFADLQASTTWRNINRRLQANIDVKNSTLNIVGKGSPDGISNAGITFFGPCATDVNVSGGKRQGSINLEGKGGIINLDGNVSVQGVYGISGWSISGANTLNDETNDSIETQINLLHNANITTNSDQSAVIDQKGTIVHCESAEDSAIAHGIYLDGNNNDGRIVITLSGNSSINTTCRNTTSISAGIRIENFTGTLVINLDNSTINATNGYGIYLDGCSNVTINLTNGASINGTRKALKFTDSTVTVKVNDNIITSYDGTTIR